MKFQWYHIVFTVLLIILICLIIYYYIQYEEMMGEIVPDYTQYPPAPISPRRRPGVIDLN